MQVNEWKLLSKVRFERSLEFYDDAIALFDAGRYRSSANRLYFSIFHAMRSVLALDGIDRKHHSGVISEFRKMYIKTGIFDTDASTVISSMSLMRHDSDYDDYAPIEKEDIEEIIPKAELFIKSVKEYLEFNLSEDLNLSTDNESPSNNINMNM